MKTLSKLIQIVTLGLFLPVLAYAGFSGGGSVTSNTTPGQLPVSITVGTSPFVYTATYAGSVTISGGSVTNTTLTRSSVAVWSVGGTAADAVIPVRSGDVVTVTYSAAKPTMYQLSN